LKRQNNVLCVNKRTAAQVWRQRPGLLLAFTTRASPGGPKTFLNILLKNVEKHRKIIAILRQSC
jgi:hypothetical protein